MFNLNIVDLDISRPSVVLKPLALLYGIRWDRLENLENENAEQFGLKLSPVIRIASYGV